MSDLYPALKVNIKDMLTGIKNNGGLGNDKLIIYICSSSYSADLIQAHYKKYIKENSIVDSVILDTLKRYDHPDYYTTSGISSILNEVAGQVPGNHYSMIIGSHAIGWISVSAWNSLKKITTAKAKYLSSFYKLPMTRAFGGSPHQIENDTLTNAIQNSSIKKLRYLLFDDCYMGNMETAYGFRNITDYMIASTCEVMSYGMPYANIWKYLVGTPNYEAVCNEFYDFYKNYGSPYGTLSTIDCSECDNMASIMKEINSKCTFTGSNDSIQALDGITSTIYYDMGDYVKNLCGKNTELYSKFGIELNKLVPYHCNTEQFYSDYSNSSINIKTFSGISISDLSNNINIANEKLNTSWYVATHNIDGYK